MIPNQEKLKVDSSSTKAQASSMLLCSAGSHIATSGLEPKLPWNMAGMYTQDPDYVEGTETVEDACLSLSLLKLMKEINFKRNSKSVYIGDAQ